MPIIDPITGEQYHTLAEFDALTDAHIEREATVFAEHLARRKTSHRTSHVYA